MQGGKKIAEGSSMQRIAWLILDETGSQLYAPGRAGSGRANDEFQESGGESGKEW